MKYGVRVRLSGEYGKELVSYLADLGLDRIKLHSGRITAEYAIPPSVGGMCRNCIKDGATNPLSRSIMGSEHASPVEGVDVWETMRYRALYGLVRFAYRFDPKYRSYMKIIDMARKDFEASRPNLPDTVPAER